LILKHLIGIHILEIIQLNISDPSGHRFYGINLWILKLGYETESRTVYATIFFTIYYVPIVVGAKYKLGSEQVTFNLYGVDIFTYSWSKSAIAKPPKRYKDSSQTFDLGEDPTIGPPQRQVSSGINSTGISDFTIGGGEIKCYYKNGKYGIIIYGFDINLTGWDINSIEYKFGSSGTFHVDKQKGLIFKPSGSTSTLIKGNLKYYDIIGMGLVIGVAYLRFEPYINILKSFEPYEWEAYLYIYLFKLGLPIENIIIYEYKNWEKYYYEY